VEGARNNKEQFTPATRAIDRPGQANARWSRAAARPGPLRKRAKPDREVRQKTYRSRCSVRDSGDWQQPDSDIFASSNARFPAIQLL
jgi:hypothetical protein